MYGTRREALKWVAGAAGMVSVGAWLASGQDASQRNPSRTSPSGDATPDATLDPKRAKAILEQNQKDIKKDIEKLFQLASELKEQVEKTDATTVLSVAMVRKTEEIEKLAHSIRDRAKG
jgi:peptidoglycan hydrolase CwlO-like protein